MKNNSIISEKSEILFLYESTYSIPNGDPFTGEQRIDETTRKILVSDVRIKRFIRDHLAREEENAIWVLNDESLKTTPASRGRNNPNVSVLDFSALMR